MSDRTPSSVRTGARGDGAVPDPVAGGVTPGAVPFDAASSPDEDSVRTEP